MTSSRGVSSSESSPGVLSIFCQFGLATSPNTTDLMKIESLFLFSKCSY